MGFGIEQFQPGFDVESGGVHFGLKVGFVLAASSSTTSAIVTHESGDNAFDEWAELHVDFEVRCLHIGQGGFELAAVVADTCTCAASAGVKTFRIALEPGF